jgi:UDP-2-acetamido-2,6-beta-L-arabino-hexul-4-ose reductase
MNIGVLGATGFIGSNLVDALKKQNHNVESYLKIRNGLELFIKHNGVIVHAAGINRGSHEEMIESNIDFTFKVAELCKKHNKRLVYIGTMYQKRDSYAFTKRIAENILEAYINNFSCDFHAVRLPNVIGKGCKPYYNSFLTTLIYEWARGNKSIESKINNIDERITFVPVEDVCEVVSELIQTKDYRHIFDCPLRHSLTFREVLNFLKEVNHTNHPQHQYFLNLLEYYKTYDGSKKNEARG